MFIFTFIQFGKCYSNKNESFSRLPIATHISVRAAKLFGAVGIAPVHESAAVLEACTEGWVLYP